MATITLSYDGRNTVAKSIVKMLETIGVFNILKDDAPNNHNIVKSPYNQEFVNKIKKSEQQISKGKFVKVTNVKEYINGL